MPIYECHCLGCDLTFEVLAPLSQARKRHECPDCGRGAQRIVSAFAIASGSQNSGHKQENGERATVKKPERPLCLQNPHLPLLCHMDEISAKRWIAHSRGRGSEFDDKLAKREEVRKQRGQPSLAKPDPDSHIHSHRRHGAKTDGTHGAAPSHSQSHEKSHSHSHAKPQGGDKPHGHSHSHGHTHSHGHAHSH
jgi:putative FmdB family regulatory protein